MIIFPKEKPDRIIETILSKIHFFGDKVYKVYKKEKHIPSNFADPQFRKDFYDADFAWNSTMAPKTYLELAEYIDANGEKDTCIVMNKIKTPSLHELLLEGKVSEDDLRIVTREMIERIKSLTELRRHTMPDLFSKSYVELDLMNLEYIRDWLYLSEELISKKEIDGHIDYLKNFIKNQPYFRDFDLSNYVTSIDSHTENILHENGKVDFIDSMPPVRDWRVQNLLYVINRPATDVVVLGGEGLANSTAMYDEYKKITGMRTDAEIIAYLQVVAALIQVSYFFLRKNKKFAQKFLDFAKKRMQDLK